MTNFTKFFSALALAAALAPAAANARSDRAPAQAQQQYLAGNFPAGSSASFARGRAAEGAQAAGQLFVVNAEQYAAAASAVPEEN